MVCQMEIWFSSRVSVVCQMEIWCSRGVSLWCVRWRSGALEACLCGVSDGDQSEE